MDEPQPLPRLGPVDFRVTDPVRSAAFWRDVIGLPLDQSDGIAVLGYPGRPLIRLHPGANGPMPEMAQGLFHIALQVPDLDDLARTAARLAASGLRHSGQDHLLSRSLYVSDPDGIKIEITHLSTHRGRIEVVDGAVAVVTTGERRQSLMEPLDLDVLRAGLPKTDGGGQMPEGTFNGHVHFRARDLPAAFDFYSRLIGLLPHMFAPATGMCDLGRADHPHLVAFNTWAGDGLVPAPPGAAGMIACTLDLPDPERAADRLRSAGIAVTQIDGGYGCTDPDGNHLHLVAAG